MLESEIPTRETETVFRSAQSVAKQLEPGHQSRAHLNTIVDRVDLSATGFTLALKIEIEGTLLKLSKHIPMQMKRRGVEMRLVIESQTTTATHSDPTLIKALGDARRWFEDLLSGKSESITAIARREKLDKRFASRALYLAFLSPRIVETILDGTQPLGFSTSSLCRKIDLDPDWDRQRIALGLL